MEAELLANPARDGAVSPMRQAGTLSNGDDSANIWRRALVYWFPALHDGR